jgi:hypothetical protein
MKKILFSIVLSAVHLSFTNFRFNSSKNASPSTHIDSVFICVSRSAYANHIRLNCNGLNRCTHQIMKVSLYDAAHKYGRQPCKICVARDMSYFSKDKDVFPKFCHKCVYTRPTECPPKGYSVQPIKLITAKFFL